VDVFLQVIVFIHSFLISRFPIPIPSVGSTFSHSTLSLIQCNKVFLTMNNRRDESKKLGNKNDYKLLKQRTTSVLNQKRERLFNKDLFVVTQDGFDAFTLELSIG